VTQFRPVPLSLVREIWKARPMNLALDKLVMKNRGIRFDKVRTEGKLLACLLRGWAMIGMLENSHRNLAQKLNQALRVTVPQRRITESSATTRQVGV
jgi:hypothetical protein